jgi:hypothetical protein
MPLAGPFGGGSPVNGGGEGGSGGRGGGVGVSEDSIAPSQGIAVASGQDLPPGRPWIKMDQRTGDNYAKSLGVRHMPGRAASVCTSVCV